MGSVLQQIKRHVVTRDGELEVTITLNLNITLNSNGEASVAVNSTSINKIAKTELEIPDFETPTELVDFGQSS